MKLSYFDFVIEYATENKCSDRSMEVKLPALLESYDRQTNRPTVKRTDGLNRKLHFL